LTHPVFGVKKRVKGKKLPLGGVNNRVIGYKPPILGLGGKKAEGKKVDLRLFSC
jgi:hypothetical protein